MSERVIKCFVLSADVCLNILSLDAALRCSLLVTNRQARWFNRYRIPITLMILTIKIIFACKQYVNLLTARHKRRAQFPLRWRGLCREETETLTVTIHNTRALITGRKRETKQRLRCGIESIDFEAIVASLCSPAFENLLLLPPFALPFRKQPECSRILEIIRKVIAAGRATRRVIEIRSPTNLSRSVLDWVHFRLRHRH